LLALVKEDGQFTRDALLKQGVKYTDVLNVIKEMREKSGPAISRSAENMYDALMKYGIDFTDKAKNGKLDPVIGRDDEVRRAIQILSRRTKNNPVRKYGSINHTRREFVTTFWNLTLSPTYCDLFF